MPRPTGGTCCAWRAKATCSRAAQRALLPMGGTGASRTLPPLMLAVLAVAEAHKKYIGELTVWPTQLSLLALNVLALATAYWGVSRMVDGGWSIGKVS